MLSAAVMRQLARRADLQRLVCVADGDRARRGGAIDLQVGTRRRGDRQRWAVHVAGQVERAARGRHRAGARQVRRHRALAGQRRAAADGHAGRVGQRAAVELDRAAGDALGRGERQLPAVPISSVWLALVMAIGARRGGAVDLQVGARRRGDRQRWAAHVAGQVERAARGRRPCRRRTVFAVTVPLPVSVAPVPMVTPAAVGERAAVELDRAVGDALGRADGQAAAPCRSPASGWRC